MTGAPAAVAVADLRERTRRTSYVVILLGAVAMAFAVLPDPASGWQVVQIDEYAGRYTSAYVGTTTAIAGAVWLGLAGFYVVRGSVARDASSRVGQVLAATPMRTSTYLLGKAISNLLVLASMVVALAAAALVLQLWRGDGALDLFALAVPFVVITLPAVAVIAAAALVFDTVPLLRAGLGNVVWFFGWLVGALAAQGAVGSFDVLGVRLVSRSMSAAIAAEYGDSRDLGVGIGLVTREEALLPFTWTGVGFPAEFLVSRVWVVAVAAAVAALTAVWFRRFDDPAAGERPAGPRSRRRTRSDVRRSRTGATFAGGARPGGADRPRFPAPRARHRGAAHPRRRRVEVVVPGRRRAGGAGCRCSRCRPRSVACSCWPGSGRHCSGRDWAPPSATPASTSCSARTRPPGAAWRRSGSPGRRWPP